MRYPITISQVPTKNTLRNKCPQFGYMHCSIWLRSVGVLQYCRFLTRCLLKKQHVQFAPFFLKYAFALAYPFKRKTLYIIFKLKDNFLLYNWDLVRFVIIYVLPQLRICINQMMVDVTNYNENTVSL